VNKYVLLGAADGDIRDIFVSSIGLWGLERAETYVMDLHRVLETLGEFPHLGRDASNLRLGYARIEHQSHAIFYRRSDIGILVVRILHRRQQARNYL
jgi:toxin ParE1/3/4